MEAFLVSTGVVALGEIGDKTQLLALMLAARFRRPVPIVLGIFAATVLNHLLAGAVGVWVTQALGPNVMRWVLGLSFLAMAAWVLIPDKLDDDEDAAVARPSRLGVFGATALLFFLAEMGDKTQIATVALAARFNDMLAVVGGTTLGMLLADVPAVLFGQRAADRLPAKPLRFMAAGLFAVMGVLALLFG
jgi:putative Ca2+/H+ antiporter (TMEM165/GDT1 family)